MEDAPLGNPQIRWWELNETSSPYLRKVAAPDDRTLIIMWSVLAGISIFNAIFVGIVLMAVLRSKKARMSSFNTYLIFLMIPDFFGSLFCGITCLLNAVRGHYYSPSMCQFQAWYLTVSFTINCWINGLIASEIHRMLRFTKQIRRFYPTPTKRVALKCSVVYVACACFSAIALLPFPWIPLGIDSVTGVSCLAVEHDRASTVFLWTLFLPLSFFIPYGYVMLVVFDIFRRKLFPPQRKRRQLAVYFFRIIFVFAFMWMPAAICLYMLGGRAPPWAAWAAGVWAHLGASVSAALSLLKKDISNAVREFLCCGYYEDSDELALSRSFHDILGMSMRSLGDTSVRSLRKTFKQQDRTSDAELNLSRHQTNVIEHILAAIEDEQSGIEVANEDEDELEVIERHSRHRTDVIDTILAAIEDEESENDDVNEEEDETIEYHSRHRTNVIEHILSVIENEQSESDNASDVDDEETEALHDNDKDGVAMSSYSTHSNHHDEEMQNDMGKGEEGGNDMDNNHEEVVANDMHHSNSIDADTEPCHVVITVDEEQSDNDDKEMQPGKGDSH